MTKLFPTSALALALAMIAGPSLAAEPDRIIALLDQQKIKYEVDKDKDYKIVYDYESDKRSQIVFVSGTVEDFGGMKIRTIFAPAAMIDKNPINDRLLSLLEANGKSKIGAWELNGKTLYFAARMVEPFTAEELSAMLTLVSSVADDMEIEISGDKDEL
jgi:hypothetical protein